MLVLYKFKSRLLSLLLLLCAAQGRGQFVIDFPFTLSGSGDINITGGQPLELGPNARLFVGDQVNIVVSGSYLKIDRRAQIIGVDANGNVLGDGQGMARFVMRPDVAGPQTIEGGNSTFIGGLPALLHLVIDNPAGVSLVNTPARVTNGVTFSNGSLLLGGQNLELASSATLNGYDNTKHIVTDGAGYLLKEGLAGGASFTFPVGRAAGDYTPATLTNRGPVNDYYVRVTDYANSTPAENAGVGIDRSWNIYAFFVRACQCESLAQYGHQWRQFQ